MKKFASGMIFAFLVACTTAYVAPPSWTLRGDGVLRRKLSDGSVETFTIPGFIAKINSEEGKQYALVVTPAGESAISAELIRLNAENTKLQNDLSNCQAGGL